MADCQITGLTNGQPATFADYSALFQPCERPRKFSAAEVGFTAGETGYSGVTGGIVAHRCGTCRHWYIGPASGRAVCEIMRLQNEANVSNIGVCRFWNRNGTDYPLLSILKPLGR